MEIESPPIKLLGPRKNILAPGETTPYYTLGSDLPTHVKTLVEEDWLNWSSETWKGRTELQQIPGGQFTYRLWIERPLLLRQKHKWDAAANAPPNEAAR